MKHKKWLLITMLSLIGCTDASMSSLTSYGSSFKVTVYSGSKPVASYISTGKVEWHDGGGGCEFKDSATQKHIRISGTIVAEEQ